MPRTLASERRKKADLDRSLKVMFQRLERRAAPDHLVDLVDQLIASERSPLKRAS